MDKKQIFKLDKGVKTMADKKESYDSQIKTSGDTWQRRNDKGEFTKGSKPTPYKGIPKETPGKGNG